VQVSLAFGAPGKDEETSELPWRQAQTKLATPTAQLGLPSSTGTDGHSQQFGMARPAAN
jgi:hypothetical protein